MARRLISSGSDDERRIGHGRTVLGEILGEIRPAATALFRDLPDPLMKIEIEVTARLGR